MITLGGGVTVGLAVDVAVALAGAVTVAVGRDVAVEVGRDGAVAVTVAVGRGSAGGSPTLTPSRGSVT
jgi:hypothetical protein